jgi:hypothetical protein
MDEFEEIVGLRKWKRIEEQFGEPDHSGKK